MIAVSRFVDVSTGGRLINRTTRLASSFDYFDADEKVRLVRKVGSYHWISDGLWEQVWVARWRVWRTYQDVLRENGKDGDDDDCDCKDDGNEWGDDDDDDDDDVGGRKIWGFVKTMIV